MKVKYLMSSPNDYRGIVALIVRNVDGSEIAYAEVPKLLPELTELVSAEVELVESELGHTWPDIRELYIEKIVKLANHTRTELVIGDDPTEYLEQMQVNTAIVEWESQGSVVEDLPVEVTDYMSLYSMTHEVAIAELKAQAEVKKVKIAQVRNIRLSATVNLSTVLVDNLTTTYESYVTQLNALT